MGFQNKKIDLHHLYQINPQIAQSFNRGEAPQPIVEANTVRIAKTADVYEHACNLTGWQQLYNQILPGKFEGTLTEVWLEDIQFFNEYTSKKVQQQCMVWPRSLWIGIPLPRNPETGFIGNRHLADNVVGVQMGGSEFSLNTPDDYTILGFVIDLNLLEYYFETILHKPLPYEKLSAQMAVAMKLSDKQKLCGVIQSSLATANADPKILNNTITKKNLRYDLLESLDCLFNSIDGGEEVALLKRAQLNHMSIVQKAHDFVMDNAQNRDEVTIVEICDYLKTSRRTLQNSFHSVWGISPITYLKAIKLNAVRRELRSPFSEFTTVQDAAMSWGFWHMGQFAADYYTQFEELPSQTLSNRIVFS